MNNRTLNIPASGQPVTAVIGSYKYFYLRSATAPVMASFDGDTFRLVNQNDFHGPFGPYDRVTFVAYLDTASTVTFYFDKEPFKAQDTQVSGSIVANVTDVISYPSNDINKCTEAAQQMSQIGNGAAGVQAFFGLATYYRKARVIGRRADGTLNAGTINIGIGNGNQPIPIGPGDDYGLPDLPNGTKDDLSKWFMNVANAGDYLTIFFA